MGSGTILREVIAAAELLSADWSIASDIWSVTSFTELRRDGLSVDRFNLYNPDAENRKSWVEQCLGGTEGPVVASTDYMRAVADMIRTWVPRKYVTLGTDGFGRSDTREALRDFYEVDRYHVTVAALKALADEGSIDKKIVSKAVKKYGMLPNRPNPWDI